MDPSKVIHTLESRSYLRLAFYVVAVVLVLIGVSSMVYTVPAESQAVVLRFGRFSHTVDSGLRFKLPFGVDQAILLPVKRQLKQEYGFGTRDATNPHQFSNSPAEQEQEKSIVTGDLNAASVEWIIQYRIRDPRQFLFVVHEPEDTLRNISESVMRETVGDRTVDEVITIGRQEIESEALLRLQEIVNKYEMGLSIDQVQLKNVNPPVPVQSSFNEVNQSQQEKEKLINVANGEYNKAVPRARGEAEQKLQAAEGYALKRINEAQGDTARFNAMFLEYLKAPDVTQQRLYLETMSQILPQLGQRIIIDADAQSILPLLQLSPEKLGGER